MRVSAGVLIAFTFAGTSLAGQTRAKGRWWPHPIWGAADQAGGSNWITPEKVLQSLKLVKTGKVYDVGQVYEQGMPMYGQRTFSPTIPAPSGGAFGANKLGPSIDSRPLM